MNQSVHVALGERSYDITIAGDALKQAGEITRNALGAKTRRVAILSNPVVHGHYGKAVEKSLKQAGFAPLTHLIGDGERAKSIRAAERAWAFLIANRFERGDAIVALGGGVVGDLAERRRRRLNFALGAPDERPIKARALVRRGKLEGRIKQRVGVFLIQPPVINPCAQRYRDRALPFVRQTGAVPHDVGASGEDRVVVGLDVRRPDLMAGDVAGRAVGSLVPGAAAGFQIQRRFEPLAQTARAGAPQWGVNPMLRPPRAKENQKVKTSVVAEGGKPKYTLVITCSSDFPEESVVCQDIYQKGERLGRQEGRQEGAEEEARKLTLHFLEQQLGKLSRTAQARVGRLVVEQLEALCDSLHEIHTEDDLTQWLKQHAPARRSGAGGVAKTESRK